MIDVGWVVLLVAGIALVLIVLPVALSASQVRRGSFFRMAESCGPWLGGVASSEDVRRFLDAGASLVQLYTGFVYGGPALPHRLLQELSQG